MRGIKPTITTILTVGLMAGSVVGVAAQDESAEPPLAPALTSGSFVYAGEDPVSFEETIQDGIQREQWVDIASVEMSDPRLSGTVTLDYTKQRFDTDDTDLAWGTVRIENDAGNWEGKMVQTSDRLTDSREVAYYELVGSGAYEGLSAIVFEAEVPAAEREWSGIIFPGDLPPDR